MRDVESRVRHHGLSRSGGRHLRRRRGQGPHQGAWPAAPSTPGCSPRSAPSAAMFRPTSPATASRCWWPPRTAWAPRSRWRSLAGVHDTVGYDLVAHCVNDILVQGAVPLFFLDYIALGRMDPDRVEAIVRGLRRGPARSSAARSSAGRPRRCRAPTRRATTTWPASSWAWWSASKALTGAAVRGGRRAARPALGRPAHQRLHAWPARSSSRRWAIGVDTALPELGPTVGEALLRPAPLLPRRSRAAARARTRSAPWPTSRAAASRATSRGSCPRAWARASAAAPGRCRPCSASSRKAAPSPTTRCSAPSTWASGMVVVVAPEDLHDVEHSLERRGEAELRHRLRGGRRRRCLRVSGRNVGVLISGRGSNLQALIDAAARRAPGRRRSRW